MLLPDLHAASGLSRELKAASGFPFLLLPGMHTFDSLANPHQYLPSSLAATRVHLALKERKWFREEDLWRISRELVALFEEMTRWKVRLPENLADFYTELERAYKAKAGDAMMFEAHLVHELWHVMESEGPGRIAASRMELSRIARNAPGPLYVLAPDPLNPAEQEFLESWSDRVMVLHESHPPYLEAVWPAGDAPDLKTRAESAPPFAANVSLFGANGLEEAAERAEIAVRSWLEQGRKSIAIVAFDRLAARRVRALLERSGILVEDETGWTLSTASASTAVMRLIDCVASGFYHADLLDFLKSPFAFRDREEGFRETAVHFLEQVVRKRGIVSGLERCLAHCGESEQASEAIVALKEVESTLKGGSRRLSEWLDALFAALDRLGMKDALQSDVAGEALLEKLEDLRRELLPEEGKFGFSSWRRWLDLELEESTFRDAGIRSPVSFTHLFATRLRRFDAALLLGCDADHLPAEENQGIFFNQAVRAELGLPLKNPLRQIGDLKGLLCRCDEVLGIWQQTRAGEPNLLSPFLEQLNAFHLHASGSDLVDRDFAAKIPELRLENPRFAGMEGTDRPAPAVFAGLIPESITASGYASLLACPYQYHAQRILGLAAMEDVETEIGKADYGSLVHEALQVFHGKYPEVSRLADPAGELSEISAMVFRDAVESDFLARAWLFRWKAMIAEYISWQVGREREGWRIASLERKGAHLLHPDGMELELAGRIDRVEKSAEGFSILDYKVKSPEALRKMLADPGEEVQLAVYALLLDEPVQEAAFLSLDGKVTKVSREELLLEENAQRLSAVFAMMRQGAGLPAQGIEEVCAYCEIRGLCRKDYWQ
ncbi:MAG: hypothetical protein HKL98_03125 [Burkholderiales bacterium]|nr:hypothetical protein [Burkholderiales bacterium]